LTPVCWCDSCSHSSTIILSLALVSLLQDFPGTYPSLTLVVAQATVPTVVLSPTRCCVLVHDNLSIYRSFHLMQQNRECANVSCPLDCITQDFAISKNRWCPFSLCKANWMIWSLWKVPISLFSGLIFFFFLQAWRLIWMILIKGVYLWWSVYPLDSSVHHQWS